MTNPDIRRELWSRVFSLQKLIDILRLVPARFLKRGALKQQSKEMGETLATLHALSRQEW